MESSVALLAWLIIVVLSKSSILIYLCLIQSINWLGMWGCTSINQSIWFMHLSVQASAYMFMCLLLKQPDYLWDTLFHLICASVCMLSVFMSQTKSFNVGITERSDPWTPQEADAFKSHLVPVSSSREQKQTQTVFSLLASMTSNRASGPHWPAELGAKKVAKKCRKYLNEISRLNTVVG